LRLLIKKRLVRAYFVPDMNKKFTYFIKIKKLHIYKNSVAHADLHVGI